MIKLLYIFIVLFTFSAGLMASDITFKLKETDMTGKIYDGFHWPEDKIFTPEEICSFWKEVSENKGNFTWYLFVKKGQSGTICYYPKIVATIPVDWVSCNKSLEETGGGNFNYFPTANSLQKGWTHSFYASEVAKTFLTVQIIENKDKNSLKKVQRDYEENKYTKSEKMLGSLKAYKYTRFQKNAMPSINVEEIVHVAYSERYIYTIIFEEHYDNRYNYDLKQLNKEVNNILDSIIIMEN